MFSVDAAADTAKSCWNYVCISFLLKLCDVMLYMYIQNGKQTLEYVCRDEFWWWIKKEPVALVWLPTLYRIATSETGAYRAV